MQSDTIKRRGRPRKSETAAAPAVPLELIHFDQLPDSAHVRLPVVRGLYGASTTSIWRNVKKGVIPSPRKLTANITAWNVGEIRAALAKRSEA